MRGFVGTMCCCLLPHLPARAHRFCVHRLLLPTLRSRIFQTWPRLLLPILESSRVQGALELSRAANPISGHNLPGRTLSVCRGRSRQPHRAVLDSNLCSRDCLSPRGMAGDFPLRLILAVAVSRWLRQEAVRCILPAMPPMELPVCSPAWDRRDLLDRWAPEAAACLPAV